VIGACAGAVGAAAPDPIETKPDETMDSHSASSFLKEELRKNAGERRESERRRADDERARRSERDDKRSSDRRRSGGATGDLDDVEEEGAAAELPASTNPLLIAVAHGDAEAVAALVAKADVDLDAVDEHGNTALILAAEGEGECLRLLLDAPRECKLDYVNTRGLSALDVAVQYEDEAGVTALLEKGARLRASTVGAAESSSSQVRHVLAKKTKDNKVDPDVAEWLKELRVNPDRDPTPISHRQGGQRRNSNVGLDDEDDSFTRERELERDRRASQSNGPNGRESKRRNSVTGTKQKRNSMSGMASTLRSAVRSLRPSRGNRAGSINEDCEEDSSSRPSRRRLNSGLEEDDMDDNRSSQRRMSCGGRRDSLSGLVSERRESISERNGSQRPSGVGRRMSASLSSVGRRMSLGARRDSVIGGRRDSIADQTSGSGGGDQASIAALAAAIDRALDGKLKVLRDDLLRSAMVRDRVTSAEMDKRFAATDDILRGIAQSVNRVMMRQVAGDSWM